MIFSRYLSGILIKLRKSNIENDNLLRVIDSAPYYQPIPAQLFREKSRVKYLLWRNKQTARSNTDRNKLLSLEGKTVLDIGCNIGYFGWSNAKSLKTYTGIDSDATCIKVAQTITDELQYRNVKFIHIDLVKFIECPEDHYDSCLFFSIYHHLLYQIGLKEARKVINKISRFCAELSFDMGQKDEPCNLSRQRWHDLLPDESPESFIKREVLTNTLFNYVNLLGQTRIGNSKRLLFKFTK